MAVAVGGGWVAVAVGSGGGGGGSRHLALSDPVSATAVTGRMGNCRFVLGLVMAKNTLSQSSGRTRLGPKSM